MTRDHPAFPGPAALGRGAVVAPGTPTPAPLGGAERILVDDAALAAPGNVADRLHRAWVARVPVVVELAVPAEDLRRQERSDLSPEDAGFAFEFTRERLHFLVWANNWDLRTGEPIWWLGRKAARLGLQPGGAADVLLPDGRPAWCDGGPRGPLAVEEAIVHRESIDLGEARWHYGTTHPFEQLAADQMQAVMHPTGPARIVAPAGSGKTRTLTARLRHLLVDRGIETTAVMALAYNARAAAELQERIGDVPAHVRTIHSLGNWILTTDRGRQRIAAEAEIRDILARLAPVRPRANQDVLAPYLEALTEVRIGLRSPGDVEERRDDVPGFADLFPRYREELRANDVIDFDEQIYGAIEALLREPELRATFQARARHLLVDEFQDLTPGYLLLLRLVAAPGYQVFGVGDDDQVIYGYAGADPGFLIDFDALFPGAAHYALEVNYRCPPEIVTAVGHLLSHNHRRIDKTITASPGRTPEAGALVVESGRFGELAPRAAATVAGWLDDGVATSQIAVLSRVNDSLLPVQLALEDSGIPYRSTVDAGFLRRTAVRAALAYLRIGLDPTDIARTDLTEVVRRPSRRLGSPRFRTALGRRQRWSVEALGQLGTRFDEPEGERIRTLAADLDSVAAAVRDGDAGAALDVIRHRVGLEGAARLLDGSRGAADRSAHTDDLDALQQAAAINPDPATFQVWLEDVLSRPGTPDGVVLSTVHRVKGMEWQRVIVFRADRGQMPHHLADDVEEERRVFHVAVTRAGERAVVLSDEAQPSPFLDELRGVAPPTPPPKAAGVRVETGDMVTAPGGVRGAVTEVFAGSVVIEMAGGGLLTIPDGERIIVGGRAGPLDTTPPPPPPVPTTDAVGDAAFEALRQWRLQRSRSDGVPAFVVLSDAHLSGIAARRPRSLEELLTCPGIGPTKLDRYGEEILDVLDGLEPAT